MCERERQTDRQTDRDIETDRDRKADTDRVRQTDRKTFVLTAFLSSEVTFATLSSGFYHRQNGKDQLTDTVVAWTIIRLLYVQNFVSWMTNSSTARVYLN